MASHMDIRPGMEVFGSDGERLGVVSEINETGFVQIVHVRGADDGDYTVPTTAIQGVEGERVLLPNPTGMYLSQLRAHGEEDIEPYFEETTE